ncbi:MAG: NTE family protein [Paraglaciecola psychrophila]|jgi:NTE family protein
MVAEGTTVSLVLGSGGARGLVHIGIINWLEEQGYRIVSIAGCSMGALVGGFYALGKLDQFADWVVGLSAVELFKLMDFTLAQGGLLKGDKIINALTELAGDALIEELAISYTAVAADISNEKEVWIQQGSLFEAIRASISLPLLFTPVERLGVQLLDGGVLNPVPIAPTFGDHSELTIAVNLAGSPDPLLAAVADNSTGSVPVAQRSALGLKMLQLVNSLSPAAGVSSSLSMYRVADQAFDAMQGTIARQKLAAYPPDILLEVPRNLCGTLEFDRAEELIAYGYDLAARSLAASTEQH